MMKLNPRKMMRFAMPLIAVGFVGFLLDIIYEVVSGRGHEYFISGVGNRLSASGVLILLVVIPFVLLFAWYAKHKVSKEEKDLQKKYGQKRNKK